LVGGVVGTVDTLLHDILKDLDLVLDVDLQIPGILDVDLNAVVAGDINVDGFVDVLGLTVPLDVHVDTRRRDLVSDLLNPLFLGGPNGFLPGLSLGNLLGNVITVVDYDLDNILDILICGLDRLLGTPSLTLLRGCGNGTFVAVPQPLLALNVDVSAAVWGDIDLDGDLDLVVCGLVHVSASTDVAVTHIYLNVNGTLTLFVNLPGLFLDPAIVLADINNDAFLDIIITGSVTALIPQPTTMVFMNNGGTTFINANVNILGVINAAIAVGDLNNDGWIDLVIAGNTGITAAAHVYLNHNGIFVAANVQLLGVISGDIELADFNNDGLLDIVLTGSLNIGGAVTKIYVNAGAGVFVDLGLALRALVSGDLLIADINVDLCLDLMLTGEVALGNPTTLVYINTACGTTVNVTAPSPVPHIYFQWLNPTDLKIWWDPVVGANTFNLAVMLGVNLDVLNLLDVDINVDVDINLGIPADWIVSPLAIPQLGGYRLVPAQGNMGPGTFTIIRGLDQTLTYVFGVQSIAANLLGSIFTWGCTGPACSTCTVCQH
jgi:hypothetical protein